MRSSEKQREADEKLREADDRKPRGLGTWEHKNPIYSRDMSEISMVLEMSNLSEIAKMLEMLEMSKMSKCQKRHTPRH